MKYTIKFIDTLDADCVEDVYDWIVEYCGDCHRYEDVTAFEVIEEGEENE